MQDTVVYKTKVKGTIQEIIAWLRLKIKYEGEMGVQGRLF